MCHTLGHHKQYMRLFNKRREKTKENKKIKRMKNKKENFAIGQFVSFSSFPCALLFFRLIFVEKAITKNSMNNNNTSDFITQIYKLCFICACYIFNGEEFLAFSKICVHET